jgi:hypothetical protein
MSTPQRVNKLKAAMEGMAGSAMPATEAPPPVEEVARREPRKAPLAPSRQGKKPVSGYINPAARTQLKVLAAEQDSTSQAMLEEALNDLFRKYGKSAIA